MHIRKKRDSILYFITRKYKFKLFIILYFKQLSVILFFMKKYISLFLLTTILLLMLTGCSEEIVITEADYIVTEGTTNAGISAGASYTDFAAAYTGFPIQMINEDGFFTPFDVNASDVDSSDLTLFMSCFVVDGVLSTTNELVTKLNVSAEELVNTLSSREYLAEHTVVFHYIKFHFENSELTDISDDYLDYNHELI